MATSFCSPTTAPLRPSSAARTLLNAGDCLRLSSTNRPFLPPPHPRSLRRAPPPDTRHGPLMTGRLAVRCGAVTTIGQSDFSGEVLGSDLPVLVEFVAEWCGPCRLISPAIEWASLEYKGRLKVVKIDHDANPQLIEEYKVYGLPALILFKNGEEVPESRREGAITKVKLKAYLDSLLESTTVV